MPTYEYACKDCGDGFEIVQSFKDDTLTECAKCHGELRKVYSAAGIIFKGSGWHIKDYGRSGGPNPAAVSPTSESTTSTSSEPSSSTTGTGSSSASTSESPKSSTPVKKDSSDSSAA